MKQYTFKDGTKIVASTKEEAKSKHKITSGIKENYRKFKEEFTDKVVELIGNKNLIANNPVYIEVKIPKSELFNGYYVPILKFKRGTNGKPILTTTDSYGHPLVDYEVEVDWNDKHIRSKIMKLYNAVAKYLKDKVNQETNALKKLEDML